jgi:hypothetical protein
VRLCVEIALGLRIREVYTIGSVYNDIFAELADASDPEDQPTVSVPREGFLLRTTYQVLDEFATYFENVRDSLRNILLEIDRYNAHTNLMKRESFWREFLVKAGEAPVEHELWDFKQSLEMWRASGKGKEDAEIRFCEHVAAFANARGGVLAVGISNERPRKIVGIEDAENRLKYTNDVILEHLKHDSDFTYLTTVIMEEEPKERICLIIAVAQTKDVISIEGQSLCPVRVQTGISRKPCEDIGRSKVHVSNKNYNFIVDLDNFLRDRPSSTANMT